MTKTDNELLIPYDDMLKAGMHFGRKKTVFNPSMEPYVFTVRDGICILDLLKTQEQLGKAAAFLKEQLAEGKLILFVALTKQSRDAVKQLADAVNMPYVLDRWLGGTLTNFKVINARVKKLEQMEQQKLSGEWEAKYNKKERLELDRELTKMRNSFGGLVKLTRIPDVVFVASVKECALPVSEAHATGVTVTGIVNTDANLKDITDPIPANDRSKVAVELIIDALKRVLTEGTPA